jgi:hypothetical protein
MATDDRTISGYHLEKIIKATSSMEYSGIHLIHYCQQILKLEKGGEISK